jgi:hypothetical protein
MRDHKLNKEIQLDVFQNKIPRAKICFYDKFLQWRGLKLQHSLPVIITAPMMSPDDAWLSSNFSHPNGCGCRKDLLSFVGNITQNLSRFQTAIRILYVTTCSSDYKKAGQELRPAVLLSTCNSSWHKTINDILMWRRISAYGRLLFFKHEVKM